MDKSDLTIEVHHIGARDGEVGDFPMNQRFLKDFLFHLYDPDPACLPQVAAINEARGLQFKLHPYVVSESDGEVTFALNHCACTSSLLPAATFKPDQYSPLSLMGDYRYRDAFRPVRSIEAPSVTLDTLAEREGFRADFLSIDTQGSEAKLLQGAARLLSSSVVGVASEVELHELYKNQPLLGDIQNILREAGFHFMRLTTREARVNFFRAGIGFRGDGMLMSADALFLRDPDHVERTCPHPRSALLKLAFFALSFGYVEYCLDCLGRVFGPDDTQPFQTAEAPAYVGFLTEVWRTYRAAPFIPQPSFADMFTPEEALRRFDTDNPHPWSTFDRDRVVRAYFAKIDVNAFLRTMPDLLAENNSVFEKLLRDYGMDAVAGDVKTRRLKHAAMAVVSLGLGEQRGRSYRLRIEEELQRLGIAFEKPAGMTPEEIRAESDRLSLLSGWEGGPIEGWQYPFNLGHGIVTKTYTEVQQELHPWRKKVLLKNLDPYFAGRYGDISVLDLGACEGSMALALWEQGVRDITCIEARPLNVEKARFVFKVKNANIPVLQEDVLSFLRRDSRRYDLVLFMGLLYHLLDPFQTLRLVADRTQGLMAIETVIAQPRDLHFDNVQNYSPSLAGFYIRHDSVLSNTAGLSNLELWPDPAALETLLTETGFSKMWEMDYGPAPISWYATKQRTMMLASK